MDLAKKLTKLEQWDNVLVLGDDEGNTYCIELSEPELVSATENRMRTKSIMVRVEDENDLSSFTEDVSPYTMSETEVVQITAWGLKMNRQAKVIYIGFSKKNKRWYKLKETKE